MPKNSLASIWSCRTQGCVRVWMSIRSAIRRRSPPNSEIVTENPSGEPSGNQIWFADSTLDVWRMTWETGRGGGACKWNPHSEIGFDRKWCNSRGLTNPRRTELPETESTGDEWNRRMGDVAHTVFTLLTISNRSHQSHHRSESSSLINGLQWKPHFFARSTFLFFRSLRSFKSPTYLSINIWPAWGSWRLKTGNHCSRLWHFRCHTCHWQRDKSCTFDG